MGNVKKILAAGDIMLDTYHFGRVERISPEAPVPVFLETGRVRQTPGGAANVAVNLAAVGIGTDIFSAAGCDRNGELLLRLLEEKGVGTDFISRKEGSTTTNKLRYIGPNHQQILRVDTEEAGDIPTESVSGILEDICKKADEYGLILLSDYKKGFLTEEIARKLILLGKEKQIPVLVDVKDVDYRKYRDAYLLKPNRQELQGMMGMAVESLEEAREASCRLCRLASCSYVLTTLGADGMLLVDAGGVVMQSKSMAKEVYDVTGAGDTSIAYLAAGILSGKDIREAMEIANYAAGVQVSKVGTSIVYPEEVELAMGGALWGRRPDDYGGEGLDALRKEKGLGKRIVFTNGCFDILHVGHVSYLRQARAMGDILVVGLNSDSSVKRLKGDGRPMNPLADRAAVLLALEAVDYVIPFGEDTPSRLIEAVRPDVLVKGGDYKAEDIVGADFVKGYGGTVAVLPFVEGKSTTGIIRNLQEG